MGSVPCRGNGDSEDLWSAHGGLALGWVQGRSWQTQPCRGCPARAHGLLDTACSRAGRCPSCGEVSPDSSTTGGERSSPGLRSGGLKGGCEISRAFWDQHRHGGEQHQWRPHTCLLRVVGRCLCLQPAGQGPGSQSACSVPLPPPLWAAGDQHPDLWVTDSTGCRTPCCPWGRGAKHSLLLGRQYHLTPTSGLILGFST